MQTYNVKDTTLELQTRGVAFGRFPVENEIVVINGLKYKISDSNPDEGTCNLQILKPADIKQ